MMRGSRTFLPRRKWCSSCYLTLVVVIVSCFLMAMTEECFALIASVIDNSQIKRNNNNKSEIRQQAKESSATLARWSKMGVALPQCRSATGNSRPSWPSIGRNISGISTPFSRLRLLPLSNIRGGSDSTEEGSTFKKDFNRKKETELNNKKADLPDNEAGAEDSYEDSSEDAEEEELVVHQAEVVLDGDLPRPPNDVVWNPTDDEDLKRQALNAKRAESREVQSGAYRRASFLWLALALDVILTKSKREGLFGSLLTRMDQVATLGPTAFLSTSFILASTLSYLLFTTISRENDSELSQSYSKTWNLSLASFSLMNLMTYVTMGQPFLGLAAAGIHVHNFLVSMNGWAKGVRGDITNDNGAKNSNIVGILVREVQNGRKAIFGGLNNLMSLGFSIGAVSSLLQALGTSKIVRSLAKSTSSSKIDVASMLMVEYATLARRLLSFGVFVTLREAHENSERGETLMKDKKFVLLHFAVAITSGLVAIANLLQWLILDDGGLATLYKSDNLSTLMISVIAPLSGSILGWIGGFRGRARSRQEPVIF